jgi:KEOPS complex subunit Cgi121
MMVEVPESLKIVGLKGKVESSDEFLKSARDFFGDTQVMVQFFNADLILGKEHIESAYEHAKRAFDTGKNISQSLAMEILIYASGEPQIANAIKKVGVKDGGERVVLVADNKVDVKGLIGHLKMERDDEVVKFSEEKLKIFGIEESEISAVPEEKKKDLVLERVAMVDVRK